VFVRFVNTTVLITKVYEFKKKTFSENYNIIINNSKLKWSCRPSSFEVLFSGLASQSFRDPMRKSGSYTASTRAIRIIYPVTVGMQYIFALSYVQIPSLHSRREDGKRFFRSISHPSSCVLSLLPPKRDSTRLLLLDYDLQLYILGQLTERNVKHLQFSIF